jgi:hypothetical protein
MEVIDEIDRKQLMVRRVNERGQKRKFQRIRVRSRNNEDAMQSAN